MKKALLTAALLAVSLRLARSRAAKAYLRRGIPVHLRSATGSWIEVRGLAEALHVLKTLNEIRALPESRERPWLDRPPGLETA